MSAWYEAVLVAFSKHCCTFRVLMGRCFTEEAQTESWHMCCRPFVLYARTGRDVWIRRLMWEVTDWFSAKLLHWKQTGMWYRLHRLESSRALIFRESSLVISQHFEPRSVKCRFCCNWDAWPPDVVIQTLHGYWCKL